ncbi:DNA/RNA non-specific endonuclease [Alteromonas sp. ZYF713]|nr:DNA/RNA non-specific endonuclease [Alteromonas sp. ZYF713]
MRIIISLFIFTCLLETSFAYSCEHLPYGKPKDSDFVKCRDGYAIGYSYDLKAAEWVAYTLNKQTWVPVDRQDDFREDTDIPVQFRTYESDYQEPVFHMGHLANSESLDKSIKQNSETFLMSNMTPQLPGHNTAVWKGLENRERKWAESRGSVYIITGGVYRAPVSYIGNRVPVPAMYYKIIYDKANNESLAYLFPHDNIKTANLDDYLTSIDVIETVSGLNFLSGIEDDDEALIEKVTAPSQWP